LPDSQQPFAQALFDLPAGGQSLLNHATGPGATYETGLDPQTAARAADLSLDAVIRRHVQYVLDLNRGNKLRTARQLQISRSTLYRIVGNEDFLNR
jgi:ActR/RegA family two-component response regulator